MTLGILVIISIYVSFNIYDYYSIIIPTKVLNKY